MPQATSPSSPYATLRSPRHATYGPSYEERTPTRSGRPRVPRTDPSNWSPEQVAQAIHVYAPPETSPILEKLALDNQIDGRTLVNCPEDILTSLTGDNRLAHDLTDVSERLRKRASSARTPTSPRTRPLSIIVQELSNYDPSSQESSANVSSPTESEVLPTPPPGTALTIPEWDFGMTTTTMNEAPASQDELIDLGSAADTNDHGSLLFPSSGGLDLLSALQMPLSLPHMFVSPMGGSLDAMVLQLQDGIDTVGSGDRPAGQDDLPSRQDRQDMPSDPPDNPESGQAELPENASHVEMSTQTDEIEVPSFVGSVFADASTQTEDAENPEVNELMSTDTARPPVFDDVNLEGTDQRLATTSHEIGSEQRSPTVEGNPVSKDNIQNPEPSNTEANSVIKVEHDDSQQNTSEMSPTAHLAEGGIIPDGSQGEGDTPIQTELPSTANDATDLHNVIDAQSSGETVAEHHAKEMEPTEREDGAEVPHTETISNVPDTSAPEGDPAGEQNTEPPQQTSTSEDKTENVLEVEGTSSNMTGPNEVDQEPEGCGGQRSTTEEPKLVTQGPPDVNGSPEALHETNGDESGRENRLSPPAEVRTLSQMLDAVDHIEETGGRGDATRIPHTGMVYDPWARDDEQDAEQYTLLQPLSTSVGHTTDDQQAQGASSDTAGPTETGDQQNAQFEGTGEDHEPAHEEPQPTIQSPSDINGDPEATRETNAEESRGDQLPAEVQTSDSLPQPSADASLSDASSAPKDELSHVLDMAGQQASEEPQHVAPVTDSSNAPTNPGDDGTNKLTNSPPLPSSEIQSQERQTLNNEHEPDVREDPGHGDHPTAVDVSEEIPTDSDERPLQQDDEEPMYMLVPRDSDHGDVSNASISLSGNSFIRITTSVLESTVHTSSEANHAPKDETATTPNEEDVDGDYVHVGSSVPDDGSCGAGGEKGLENNDQAISQASSGEHGVLSNQGKTPHMGGDEEEEGGWSTVEGGGSRQHQQGTEQSQGIPEQKRTGWVSPVMSRIGRSIRPHLIRSQSASDAESQASLRDRQRESGSPTIQSPISERGGADNDGDDGDRDGDDDDDDNDTGAGSRGDVNGESNVTSPSTPSNRNRKKNKKRRTAAKMAKIQNILNVTGR